MRSMARPLAQSPMVRPAAGGRPGQMQRTLSIASSNQRQQSSVPPPRQRVHGEPGIARHHMNEAQHRQALVHRPLSTRQEIRRRRANVLFVLFISSCTTLFLAATTHTNAMMYAFALSFLALCGYCYKLVQINFEIGDDHIAVEAQVDTVDRTGVEMEALTACSVAALTVYDMCKSADRSMKIGELTLWEKTGGRSGTYRRDPDLAV